MFPNVVMGTLTLNISYVCTLGTLINSNKNNNGTPLCREYDECMLNILALFP